MSSLIIPVGPAAKYKGTWNQETRYNKANIVTMCACQFICKVNGQMARPPLVIDDTNLGTYKFANEDIWACSIDQLEWWNRQHVILATIEELVRQYNELTDSLKKSENERVKNENERISNEIERRRQELIRIQNEIEREQAERERNAQEIKRNKGFDELRKIVDNEYKALEQKVNNTYENLLKRVNNAIDISLTVARNPTYVGEDYYVYRYILEEDCYERTDIYLKGEDLDWEKMTDEEKDDLCNRIEIDRILDPDIEDVIGKVEGMDEEDDCVCLPLRVQDILEATGDNVPHFTDPLEDSTGEMITDADGLLLFPKEDNDE